MEKQSYPIFPKCRILKDHFTFPIQDQFSGPCHCRLQVKFKASYFLIGSLYSQASVHTQSCFHWILICKYFSNFLWNLEKNRTISIHIWNYKYIGMELNFFQKLFEESRKKLEVNKTHRCILGQYLFYVSWCHKIKIRFFYRFIMIDLHVVLQLKNNG